MAKVQSTNKQTAEAPVKQEPTKDQTKDKPKTDLPTDTPKKPTVHDFYPGGVFMD